MGQITSIYSFSDTDWPFKRHYDTIPKLNPFCRRCAGKNYNEAPRSKLRGIKRNYDEAKPLLIIEPNSETTRLRSIGLRRGSSRHLSLHKLQDILAKPNNI